MSPRYRIVELEGYGTTAERHSKSEPALSCIIQDTYEYFRVVRIYRSEGFNTSGGRRVKGDDKRRTREIADVRCAELNARAA